MTPEEFAEAHGLSLEEAQLILEKRAQPVPPPGGRLARALKALREATTKVGASPVRLNPDGTLEKSELQDLTQLEKFYATKGMESGRPARTLFPQKPLVSEEDVSQDPKDWK